MAKKRTKASRKRARRRYLESLAQGGTGGDPATRADSGAAASPHQGSAAGATVNNSLALPATRESADDSPFWPELSQAARLQALADGDGEELKRINDIRLEIRAVNEQWPIPREMRERQVYEAFRIMEDPRASVSHRILANRLLTMMGAANRRIDLPAQVVIEQPASEPELPSVNELLDELRHDPGIVDAHDYRVYQPEIGAADDYAD